MKGSTHLAIGIAIGAAAAAYYPFAPANATIYIAVAAFSALSPDLDGTNMLSSKLGKLSHLLRELALFGGLGMIAAAVYLYVFRHLLYPNFAIAAVVAFLLGLVTKEGMLRNALVCLAGCGLIYWGLQTGMNWLTGLGVYIAWVPWLNHRGLSHTCWALAAWSAIGWGLEKQLALQGIAAVAAAGYFSHLAADTLTPSGVKWLYPLYKRSIRLPH
ncbi:metal-dependent hydrolase [Paenibacillus humicola]|uniref:metal-dependent hydrolase n=1 Tax=Paenibacillus humicola TaxID=3110540 RepID=UPI00237C4118|nr:metal-dependent hydrolase [Paenibacillus humicola]